MNRLNRSQCNTVRRDCIFESVATNLSSLSRYVISSYESPSFLLNGSYTLHSSEGVQQGDPLGPYPTGKGPNIIEAYTFQTL